MNIYPANQLGGFISNTRRTAKIMMNDNLEREKAIDLNENEHIITVTPLISEKESI